MDQVAGQLLQPNFFYSTLLLLIAFGSVVLLSKINSGIGSRWKSIAYVLPLLIPLLVLAIYPPSLYMSPGPSGASILPWSSDQWATAYLSSSPVLPPMPSAPEVLSITGILLIAGLVLFAASLLFSALLGDRVARRTLGVIDLSPEDFPSVQRALAELAEDMEVPVPRIGLVEDLRPNAFTFGTGKKATVVLSIGLIELLTEEEVKAVMAHELAHIKNNDVRFKTLTRALALLSFFNPLSHLAVRAARRERERMADDMAQAAMGTDALVSAIEKVTSILNGTRAKRSVGTELGLGFALSLGERASLMSTHPSFSDRVRSIRHLRSGPSFSRPTCLVLSVVVLIAAALLVMSLGEVRADIIHSSLSGGLGQVPLAHHFDSLYYPPIDGGNITMSSGPDPALYHGQAELAMSDGATSFPRAAAQLSKA